MAFNLDPNLEQYATDRQWQLLSAWAEHGSQRAASEALGVAKAAFHAVKAAVEKKAAQSGYAPDYGWQHQTPPGYVVKGVSTLRDMRTGEAVMQWEKTTADAEAQKLAQQAALDAMSETIRRVKPIPPPKNTESLLCNLYTITDCHVGMLAWAPETGADWDTSIAEKTIVAAFQRMVSSSPPAESCVIAQIGDFMHFDGLQAITPTSGHLLDSDTRFSNVVAATIRIMRAVVDLALARHDKVHLIMGEGNHDISAAVWLRHMFKALYENEPRLDVNDSELPYYVYQHGLTMLSFHHGHVKKKAGLPLLMAAQYPKVWGATKYRYCHTGHEHHKDVKEHSGIEVMQHPTIASRDAYAARGGWHSHSRVISITYHKEYGEYGSVTITPEMLK